MEQNTPHTRRTLAALIQDYRRGSVLAEAELGALGTTRIDDLAQAFGRERASEGAERAFVERLERDGFAGLVELVARTIVQDERTVRRSEARRRRFEPVDASERARVLDASAITTDAVLAACRSKAPFVLLPIDTTEVYGVDRKALGGLARDLRKRGRDEVVWTIEAAGGVCSRVLVVRWRTERSRGQARFVVAPISTRDVAPHMPLGGLAAALRPKAPQATTRIAPVVVEAPDAARVSREAPAVVHHVRARGKGAVLARRAQVEAALANVFG